ncbi:uncharacterized protein LOC129597362 [Paramacrobiotus metropolitanus]|uniref:uncharacterized protein LOC129597362 n=1 Tax=Paramacrobiotus metropolitanus TaxID=2943436 RepID=UPI002445D086|nr:uncharacterized protein LOC129597362 [Paramacrobiotus metropolitanus]XP_055350828.1 uncharacterized protein LOC129597362 [Paramacrobiotus metropolitanus]
MSTRIQPLRNTMQVAIPSRPSSTCTTAVDAFDKDHHRAELKKLINPLHPGFPCVLTQAYLGRGGQTVAGVYVAENPVTGEQYAAKLLPADDWKVINDTVAEFHHIGNKHHINLVKYHGIKLNIAVPGRAMGTQDELWLIMELCEEYTLRELAKRKLAFERIVDIAQQILRGLHHLHVNKIVHRDLKCQNVLVGLDGTIKLADFGLIKKLEGTMTKTKELPADKGTYLYMAPEVFAPTAECKIGRKSDIWSFGCLLSEMMTGDLPKYAMNFTNDAQIVYHIGVEKKGPLFPAENLLHRFSSDQIQFLEQIFWQCTATEPRERPHASDLLKYFETGIVAAKPKADVDALARALHSWDISNDNRRTVTQSLSFDGGGGLLSSARSLLADARRMKENPFPEQDVAKFRCLPFEHDRYIIVHTKDAKTFISQFTSTQRNPTSGRIPVGILVESLDSDLLQHADRAETEIRMGTLDIMKGHAFDTMFVWPNGARREDMWTRKDQLEGAFSLSAVQLIVVGPVLNREFQQARSRWKQLIDDAKEAKRLAGLPPSATCRSG